MSHRSFRPNWAYYTRYGIGWRRNTEGDPFTRAWVITGWIPGTRLSERLLPRAG